ncbi:hypothetical protein K469DRAFT_720648 [Zopfia rhizophila CBS 207.26]|uniref:Uncharacterized protein n=1 Tax=Zopfia rhizophila CBS 207.26 TaxID=1314779 RepID=A0A6A6EIS6_9PEZI|nr:hypothetical protein K469DRAFT_720648 [Zopfia rhizophila CBS 207.26]
MARYRYQLTFAASASDSRFYKASGPGNNSKLMVWGDKVAMGLFDAPNDENVVVREDEGKFDDKWMFMESNGGMFLRHAQDFGSSSTPSGGAGSWRACKQDTINDYQIFWYDGSSPLPIKNCEGIQLEAVASAPSATPTASGSLGTLVPTSAGPTNASGTVSPTPPAPAVGAGSRVSQATALVSFFFSILAFAV